MGKREGQARPRYGTALTEYDAVYEDACRAVAAAHSALALAKSVDEATDIRNRAEGIRAYAKQAKNKSLEVNAAEIRFRAERRLGEMIFSQKESGGLAKGGAEKGVGRRGKQCRSKMDPHSEKLTLADAGIDKHLADRVRKLAAIPERKFETIIITWRDRINYTNERVTTNLLKVADVTKASTGTHETEQLSLFASATFDLTSSGRKLEKSLRANRFASAGSKLQHSCESIIKIIVESIRRLEVLAARIDEVDGIANFQEEFNRMEERVTRLVNAHWQMNEKPIRPQWVDAADFVSAPNL